MFCIFIYITTIDFIRSQQADHLLVDIDHNPVLSSNRVRKAGCRGCSWRSRSCAAVFIGGEFTVRSGSALAVQIRCFADNHRPVCRCGRHEHAGACDLDYRGRPRWNPILHSANVIGSNIFNSLLVLPVSGLIAQIPIPTGGVGDLVASWVLAAALIPIFFFRQAHFGRAAGVVFVAAYFGYAAYRILGPT